MSETEKQAGVATATDHLPDGVQSGGRLDVFADERRRHVLAYLAECDGPASFDELVVAVAAAENETSPETIDESAAKPVAIGLHHVHLPKLLHEGYLHATEDGLSLGVEESALTPL